jgi:4-amino-4-deoxy-L-arabinose transferase-like glycosyltransferase
MMQALRAILKDRIAASLLLGSMALHLLLALSFHLSPDETQYTLYSAHIDWSYFDHPPLVGWLQWPWGALRGSDVLMRIVPMASWAMAALGVVVVTAELYPTPYAASLSNPHEPSLPPSARVALGLWALSPLPHLLGLALVPDSLLMPIVCFVMWATWRLCDATHVRRLSLWLALGVGLGLAGLSKYTAILIGFGAVLALLKAHGPRLLALPGPWLGVLLAGVLISPVLLWNATHNWISFAYQLGHAAGSAEWRLGRVGAFLMVQLFGYGVLLLVGLWGAWREQLEGQPIKTDASVVPTRTITPLLFCACFGLPALVLMAYLSGRGSTLPHWSASAWAALVPAAAAGCLALWQRRRTTLIFLGGFQTLSCAALASLMLTGGTGSESGAQANSAPGQMQDTAQFNPFTDLYGWDAAARRGRVLAEQNGNATLAVFNWTLASRIAWYARPLGVKVVQRHLDQFGLWWGVLQPGESVLLLDWSQMSFAPPVGPNEFEHCDLLEQGPVMRLGRQIAHFNYLLCRNWQGPKETALDRRN